MLSRSKLRELVHQIDSRQELDADVEAVLLEMAEDFVDNVTSAACDLAKHRKSESVSLQDFQLHLERTWNIRTPGLTSAGGYYPGPSYGIAPNKKQISLNTGPQGGRSIHRERLRLIAHSENVRRQTEERQAEEKNNQMQLQGAGGRSSGGVPSRG